jgi:ech hydrogenase subunit A
MLFHAVSKSMLFQDVGATENALHSRDIEDFHGLLYRLPRLAMFQFIGIAGMFLAPFGMLISKWAALRASVDEGNILLVFFIVFGSAITSFYWTKWMGKLLEQSRAPKVRDITKVNEIISLTLHAVMMIGLCLLFPLLSKVYVDPLLTETFGSAGQVLPTPTLILLIVIICLVFAVPGLALFLGEATQTNIKPNYMNGINDGTDYGFIGSYGEVRHMHVSNYYFAHTIGQRRLMLPCQIFTSVVIVAMVCMVLGGVV